jgi:hypothetical protein
MYSFTKEYFAFIQLFFNWSPSRAEIHLKFFSNSLLCLIRCISSFFFGLTRRNGRRRRENVLFRLIMDKKWSNVLNRLNPIKKKLKQNKTISIINNHCFFLFFCFF